MIAISQILSHYRMGYFPMGQDRDDPHYEWFNPPARAILPIRRLMISDALRDRVLDGYYEIRVDTAFDAVIEHCAESTSRHPSTWINEPIMDSFKALHRAGHAHSVECWREGRLEGGLYGLIPGGSLFCGESMFSIGPRASTVALVHLCARLWAGGFMVLDSQILNEHTARLGAFEIRRTDYLDLANQALQQPADFFPQSFTDEQSLVRAYFDQL